MTMIKFQAHRGLSTTYPENTLIAFEKAIEAGYELIELDCKMTKDNQCVILHDPTIERTGRLLNGQALTAEQVTNVNDLTLAELKSMDFGIWKDESFKGVQIPTLAEVIELIEAHDVIYKFDNVYEKFSDEQIDLFFKELASCKKQHLIAVTCTSPSSVQRVVDKLPKVAIHYDGPIEVDILKQIKLIIKNQNIMFWIGFPNEHTSWNKYPKASVALCKTIKEYGELGIWTISTREEYERSVHEYQADAIETNGDLVPEKVN